MNNIKKITLTFNGDAKEDLGEEISFEPKFYTHVSTYKGTGQTKFFNSMFPEIKYNGREVIIILSAPDDILQMLKPIINNIVEQTINT